MSEQRSGPRRRLLKSGRIFVSAKAPVIECAVRNFSERGACLQLSTTFGIPPIFDLVIDGAHHSCRVAWKTEVKIGVAFTD